MSSGVVVWVTGLPASGKSTLARHVRDQLMPLRACVVLDSDEIRAVLRADAYDEQSRTIFYRTLRELALVLARQGLVVLVAATAPRREHRFITTNAIRVLEVYVRTPLEVCETRDVKGLYRAARGGTAPTLPGVGAMFEPPLAPDVVADGGHDTAAVDSVVALLR
jgi:adenylylsulfate kinase